VATGLKVSCRGGQVIGHSPTAEKHVKSRYKPVIDEGEFSVDAVSGDEFRRAGGRHEVAGVWAARHLQAANSHQTAVGPSHWGSIIGLCSSH